MQDLGALRGIFCHGDFFKQLLPYFIHRERNTSLPSACDSFPGSAHLTEEQCGINFPFTFGIFLPLFSECAIIVSLFYNSCMSGSQKLATC